MQEVTKYPSGTFSWVELSTSDPEGAKAFYTELFGWTYEDTPIPGGGVYTMLNLHGKSVAALNSLRDDEIASGHPPYWSSYITVYDIEERTQKAADLGATIAAPPFDVLDSGRMSVIQDPTGAFFNLWEPNNHIGASYVNMPGAFVWNELITTDMAKASEFYNGLFGWNGTATTGAGGSDYIMVSNGERAAGGILPTSAGMGGSGVPSHWLIYLMVENLDQSLQKAESLGAKRFSPILPMGDYGRLILLADPQGATFYIMEASYADPPPHAD